MCLHTFLTTYKVFSFVLQDIHHQTFRQSGMCQQLQFSFTDLRFVFKILTCVTLALNIRTSSIHLIRNSSIKHMTKFSFSFVLLLLGFFWGLVCRIYRLFCFFAQEQNSHEHTDSSSKQGLKLNRSQVVL